MKLDVTADEVSTLVQAVAALRKSAERAQTAKRGQPQISAVFEAEASRLAKLEQKLLSSK